MSAKIWWYSFCGNRSQKDAFWDYQLSVNTSNPDLTRCFQTTVLSWLPCAVLLTWSPLHILYLSRRPTLHHEWYDKSCLNILKLVLGILLSITSVLQLIWVLRQKTVAWEPPPSEFVAPCINLCSLVLATVFIHYEFKKGIVSSGILFVFWLLMTLCNIVTFRSYILDAQEQDEIQDMYTFVTFYVYFGLLVCQFLLTFKADCAALVKRYGAYAEGEKKPLLHNTTQDEEWVPTPQAKASFFSKITWFWPTGLFIKGYRKVLEFSDLHDLMYDDKSNYIVRKCQKAIGDASFDSSRPSSMHIGTLLKRKHGDSDMAGQQDEKTRHKQKVCILKAITVTCGWTMIAAAISWAVALTFAYINPQLLRLLIAFIEGNDPFIWKGYLIAVLLWVSSFLNCLFTNAFNFLSASAGMKARTVITCAIYRKAIRLSNAARRDTTVGEIVNLMAVDAIKIQESGFYLHLIWAVPVLIAMTIYFLWSNVGPSSLAGFAVLMIIVPTNAIYLANKIRCLQATQMNCKDVRIKMMNEILSGMKVLKFYAWEPSFKDKVLNIREAELSSIKTAAYINAVGATTWFLAPYLVSLAMFAVYVLSSPNNILDADKAFVSLSLINVLQYPLAMLPMGVAYAGQCAVSIKRINKFLQEEELSGGEVQRSHKGDSIRITNGAFSWSNDEKPALSKINFSVPDGGLIGVVGQVGSGKSSLIASLLGEMHVLSGDVTVKGSVAYVPQQAWIQNATVKDNILFGKPFKQLTYQQVIKVTALEQDLHSLPGKDLTEIGEKGINMSGGQKQRVSLARAVYQDCDVYLLDDPLSAVDAHVGRHIFEQVVGPKGVLQHKTRILVTHGVTYLPHVDRIIVIKDGCISEMGTYEELLGHNGAFAEFISTYLNEEDSFSESDAEESEAREELRRRLTHLAGQSGGDHSASDKIGSESGKATFSDEPTSSTRYYVL